MALRLHGIVEYGELRNKRRNSTHGFLKLRGQEMPIHVDLTGDMSPDLHGKTFCFEPNPERQQYDDELSTSINPKDIYPHQVGATGTMTAARWVKVADCTDIELYMRAKAGEKPPLRWVRSLYLEWFSQNGRVVIELADPKLEIGHDPEKGETTWEPMPPLDFAPPPDKDVEASAEAANMTDDFATLAREESALHADHLPPKKRDPFQDADDDIYALDENPDAPEGGDLENYLGELRRETDESAGVELPPEFPPEFLLEMEIIEGEHDDDADHLLTLLPSFDPDTMNDEEAESMLKVVLARLALYGIAIHQCEHFSALDTLKLIKNELAVEAKVHPGLIGSGWVNNFMTSESCEICEAEAERDYEEFERKRLAEEGQEPEKNPDDSGRDDRNPDIRTPDIPF